MTSRFTRTLRRTTGLSELRRVRRWQRPRRSGRPCGPQRDPAGRRALRTSKSSGASIPRSSATATTDTGFCSTTTGTCGSRPETARNSRRLRTCRRTSARSCACAMTARFRRTIPSSTTSTRTRGRRFGVYGQIWSLGHRNVLGLAFGLDGRLWEVEMGPKGGDELNLIKRAANYGYPIVSNGDHYDDRVIPDHETHPEFEKPAVWWTPVISPGNLMIYRGNLFSDWRGDAFIAVSRRRRSCVSSWTATTPARSSATTWVRGFDASSRDRTARSGCSRTNAAEAADDCSS